MADNKAQYETKFHYLSFPQFVSFILVKIGLNWMTRNNISNVNAQWKCILFADLK